MTNLRSSPVGVIQDLERAGVDVTLYLEGLFLQGLCHLIRSLSSSFFMISVRWPYVKV